MAEDTRPNCKCHDVPMLKDGHMRGRQKWQCGVMERARQAALYRTEGFADNKRQEMRELRNERHARGVCVRCQGPLLSDFHCWDCLNQMEETRAFRI